MNYDKIVNRLKLVFPSFAVFTDYDEGFDVYDSLSNTQTRGVRLDDTRGNYFFVYKALDGYTEGGLAFYTVSVLLFMQRKCNATVFDATLKCALGAMQSICGKTENLTFTTNKRAIIDRETAGFGGLDIDRTNHVLERFWLLRIDFKIGEALPFGNCPCENCDC